MHANDAMVAQVLGVQLIPSHAMPHLRHSNDFCQSCLKANPLSDILIMYCYEHFR